MHLLDPTASAAVCGAYLAPEDGVFDVVPRHIRIILPPLPDPGPDKLPPTF